MEVCNRPNDKEMYKCVCAMQWYVCVSLLLCRCLFCYHVQALELELLKANQKLAVGASEHTQEMKEQAAQLERCRVSHCIVSSLCRRSLVGLVQRSCITDCYVTIIPSEQYGVHLLLVHVLVLGTSQCIAYGVN